MQKQYRLSSHASAAVVERHGSLTVTYLMEVTAADDCRAIGAAQSSK